MKLWCTEQLEDHKMASVEKHFVTEGKREKKETNKDPAMVNDHVLQPHGVAVTCHKEGKEENSKKNSKCFHFTPATCSLPGLNFFPELVTRQLRDI